LKTPENLVSAGKISSPHGIKGQVKIFSHLEYPEKFAKYKKFYLSNQQELKIKFNFVIKNFAVVTIEGVTDRNSAETFSGKEVFIQRTDLPKLKKQEFYQVDLIGLNIYENGQNTGIVENIVNFGSGDLLDIKFIDGERHYFIFNDKNFPEIDIENKKITLNRPEVEFT
jgi:16S rRNA processing protein RimM